MKNKMVIPVLGVLLLVIIGAVVFISLSNKNPGDKIALDNTVKNVIMDSVISHLFGSNFKGPKSY